MTDEPDLLILWLFGEIFGNFICSGYLHEVRFFPFANVCCDLAGFRLV